MAKPKLFAAIVRHEKVRPDGSFGVVILDHPHGWKPTKKEREKIHRLCEQAANMADDDTLKPGCVAWIFDGPVSEKAGNKFARDHAAFVDPASNKFCVGLFIGRTHPQHETLQ